ncbi:MAG: hypothetical protein H0S79_09120 [Anaerolineaceae bacterium]|nr:hypothetical protein [Anaerolineaceae bacterium]
MKNKLRKLPGWIAIAIITLLNALWIFWGMGESFYEGWGVEGSFWFIYLIFGVVAMLFSVAAIRWPKIGGGILVAAGLGFAIWWLLPGIKNGFYTLSTVIERLFLSAGFSLVGFLFILDGKLNPHGEETEKPWALRHLRMILAIGIPTLTALVMAAVNLPTVLTRIDDGDRSARLIDGNGVSLIWAPAGPGWNWKQDFGGYPSWRALAVYGVDPVGLETDAKSNIVATEADMAATGLCAYLTEDGTALSETPLYIWRMPTVDELARSLSLHNENAGCTWSGETGEMDCMLRPDKETPLWAPDQQPVYLWSADAYNEDDAYYVSYTGFVSHQPKTWGNPRHGYRCVKEP